MRPEELRQMGIPGGVTQEMAIAIIKSAIADGMTPQEIKDTLVGLVATPEQKFDDRRFGPLARKIDALRQSRALYVPRQTPAEYRQWGDDIEAGALLQMKYACDLPVAVRGALMPDAHEGYGLPIGGVLAVKNAVIPYAVGMDIGCRMKLSVIDWPVSALRDRHEALAGALERETRFGVGAKFRTRRQHAVMDADWSVSPVTERCKDLAHAQLGTSGSGNHFVEFGTLTLDADDLGLKKGVYLALLSHSGARGTGAEVAKHYSRLAMSIHGELPKELKHLSFLDLNSEYGEEYWQAMELMGRYSAANHELIHRYVTEHLGAAVLAQVENHHNFAWKEVHFGEDVIVHRKGATPATKGTLGVIPGSMGTAGYVTRGKGAPESLNSASHGAGRRMSRKAAKERYNWADLKRFLDERGVWVLSAGVDEVPMAYKDIDEVMAAQRDLVTPVARFDPKLVKMAPAGH
ncbi:MAG: RtcB family protein [Deltaproteobacteria bacterium]|nr:RtcB family protein [Deltaproteobacteria bacterium]